MDLLANPRDAPPPDRRPDGRRRPQAPRHRRDPLRRRQLVHDQRHRRRAGTRTTPTASTRRRPDWKSPYTQLRFGIYCQDHVEHTGGLNLKIGSHDIPATSSGETLYVKTRPGDLAVWSMRITHSGNGDAPQGPGSAVPGPLEHGPVLAPDEVAPSRRRPDRRLRPPRGKRQPRQALRRLPQDADLHRQRLAQAARTTTTSGRRPRRRGLRSCATCRPRSWTTPTAGLNDQWQPFPYAGWTPPSGRGVGHGCHPAPTPKPADQAKAAAQKAASEGLRRGKAVARAAIRAWRDSAKK